MHEDHGDAQDPVTAGDDYVTPLLTDLGSFEELTQNNLTGSIADAEGFS